MSTNGERAGDDSQVRGAFPVLDASARQVLVDVGERRSHQAGEPLFVTGDTTYDLTLVLSGSIAVVEGYRTAAERIVAIHGPGRFLGELNLLTGQAAYLSAVAQEDTEVVAVPSAALRRVLAEEPTVSDVIMRALLLRRSILLGASVGLRVIGSRYSADTGRLLEFLARSRVPSTWIDLEEDSGAEHLLTAAGVRPEETPVVFVQGDTLLRNPSIAELAAAIGLSGSNAGDGEVWDLVVVGSGPAGLAASVYGASEGLRTLGLDGVAVGGQAGTSSRIENYLGFPAGLSGSDLAARAAVQAEKFGARLASPVEVAAIRAEGHRHVLTLSDGTEATARSVVLATGARYRRLDAPGVSRFEGTGVYYAATHAEAARCHNRPGVVIGGGNSAGQAAVFLAARLPHVHLLIRRADLAATMSRYLISQVESESRITVHRETELAEVLGGQQLNSVRVRTRRGDLEELTAGGIFVFIGAKAQTDWLQGYVQTDRSGFVCTGDDVEPGTPSLATSRPGVFAVGDVRAGSTKRVATAVGEGSQSVSLVHQYLSDTFARV